MNDNFYTPSRRWKRRSKPAPVSEGVDVKPRPYSWRHIIPLVLMALTMAGVAIFFALWSDHHGIALYESLPVDTTRDVSDAQSNRGSAAAGAFRPQPDTGISTQVRPENLSPLDMARAMSLIRAAQDSIGKRELEAAETQAGQALAIWPDMNVAIRMMGSIHTRRGRHDEAIEWLERALLKEPFSAEALNNLAINYMEKGDTGRAEELLISALQIRPDYALAQLNLGLLHMNLGRYEQAAENLATGLRGMPEPDGAMINNLAVCLIRLGEVDKAREYLDALIATEPERAATYFNIAVTCILKEDHAAAVEWMRRGAAHGPPGQLAALVNHGAFDAVRADPAFQAFLREFVPEDQPTPAAP